MPVYKYRHVGDMEERSWREPGDPALCRAIRGTWDFARRTIRSSYPPGVYRHASIVEAGQLRDAWERTNFESFRARRARSSDSAK